MNLFELNKEAGWKVEKHGDIYKVRTQYDEIQPLKFQHPCLVHLELYRYLSDPAKKYDHLKLAHDILWPQTVWHEWTERRFRTFCEPWNYITLAAGASASKSYDIAKYGILFWYAAPSERNVTVASVTQASLLTRVWGYLTAHIKDMAVKLPYKYLKAGAPKILLEEPQSGKNKIDDDTLHGIFAVTAKQGDSDQAIGTWIGKHPIDMILLVLDECTNMPMSITSATPNLDSHPKKFQLIGIGNSDSTLDLHGTLSTPECGWHTISIDLQSWRTTQRNGICMYFNPYESPAITHPDPEMRKILGNFLISKEILEQKEKELGKDSDKFYRWVLGFWKNRNLDDTVVTEAFLNDKTFYTGGKAEWSGFFPLMRVASLDPSFSAGGDKCIFRMATVGHSMTNKVKIDLNEARTMHEIPLSATSEVPLEKQLGLKCIEYMKHYNIKMENLAIDVTGQGRAIAQVIVLLNEIQGFPLGHGAPLKIYSMSPHNLTKNKKSASDILPYNAFLLWMELRGYLEQGDITGLDERTRYQLTNRQILYTESRGKRIARLESKLEYKRRMSAIGNHHSPDEADAAALIVQVVKRRLGIEPGTLWNPPKNGLDQYSHEKLVLHGMGMSNSSSAMVLEADFSSGLESFEKYSKFI